MPDHYPYMPEPAPEPEPEPNPNDLDQLDKEGLITFLKSDRKDKVEIWNKWRLDHFNQIDLREVNLRNAELSKADFRGIDFRGAELSGANLSGVILSEVNLSQGFLVRANLNGADLRTANLTGVNLGLANLIGANLDETDLSQAMLYGANLSEAKISRANLRKAYLIKADLGGTDLSKADMTETHLREANLSGADLVQVDLSGADLIEADLTGANLLGANLSGAILSEAKLSQTTLTGVKLTGANLYKAHLEGAVLDGANLANADLYGAHFRDTALSNVAPGGLRGVKLYHTYFWGVLSLRYQQFLEDESDSNSASTIWEDVQDRYYPAKGIYKSLKGYFEDAGDYEGANWAYKNEKIMEKLSFTPEWARRFYPNRLWKPEQLGDGINLTFWKPNLREWLRLEISDKLAGYGLSLAKPLIWLVVLMLGCGVIYGFTGMITTMPGCGYDELRAAWLDGCAPTYNLIAGLKFSLGAMTTIDIGGVQAYRSEVGLLAAVEALLAIALTGLFGFVLGNYLRNS